MATLINHLLAHHLASNDSVPSALPYVLSVLQNERAIVNCEAEEGLGGPVLHRWNLRLASLIQPSLLPPIRTAGFRLLLATLNASTTSLLTQSKAALAPSLNIVGHARSDPSLFVAAMEVTQTILVRSTWHAEWAREVVGAAVVQRTVQGLVAAVNGEVSELKLPALNAIVSLLPLFPTPLRPLSPSLHSLAIALLCDPSGSQHLIDAGANLFVSLYLLAPKGRDGLRDAWRKGIEALTGSIDVLVNAVTSEVFAEDPLTNHTLSPLALPALENPSPTAALVRLEAISQALCLALRTPTSERTGPVEVPVGAVTELGVRLVGMSADMPVKERTDPTTVLHSITLLPRLQVVGCQLLAQLALCVGPRLVAHGTEILGTVSRTLSTYPLRSPMRPVLSTSYSIILVSLGASVDPEEGKKSLARVWRSVLEDIGSVAVEPVAAVQSEDKGRKNKRQKTYDPSESMDLAGRRVRLDEADLAIAERGLATLETLLQAPHSHFLPPKLQIATSRLLLAISLDPAFFAAHPSSAESAAVYPATSASKGIDIAKQSNKFRRGVLKSLKASLEGAGGAEGLVDRAVEVWRRGATDGDEEIRSLSVVALSDFIALVHPSLPPLPVNTTFARLQQERLGGPVGDEISILEGANEFRAKEIEPKDASSMDIDAATVEVEAEPVAAPAPTIALATAFPQSFGGAPSGFAFASTTFQAPTPAPQVASVPVIVDAQPEAVPFISAPTGTVRAARPQVVEEDSDEDDAMPAIVMESDDEE